MRAVLLAAVLALCAAAAITTTSSAQRVTIHLRLHGSVSDAEVEAAFWARSTPGSPLFRKFLTKEQLRGVVGASDADVKRVVARLEALGERPRIAPMRDYVSFDTACDSASVGALGFNRACATDARFGLSHVADREIASSVKAAHAVPHTEALRRHRLRGEFPGENQSPTTIRSRYHIPDANITQSTNTTTQAVAEFEGEQFYQANIATFSTRFAPGGVEQLVDVVGPNNGGYFGEGNLDLEYISALAPGTTTWWVAENYFDLTSWCQTFLTIEPMPTVASISWGSGESGYERSGIDSDNHEFKKLGLLGVSVLTASGDHGTGSTGFFSCGKFDPTWPASSPFVTAVGATYSMTNSSDEVAWAGSGGGFSSFYAAPAYQQNATQTYLSSGVALPSATFYNQSGRGTPDVAALGTNFEVYSSGWGTETGTSAATPTFASIVTRINAARSADGKAALGFLNPALYRLGRVGFDVTTGDNKNPSCPAGFKAAAGWDPISGLGTPDYNFLKTSL